MTTAMAGTNAYHHGDLREALMTAALETIARDGVAAVSLRRLARDAGVSHGAPAHHFRDRAGLYTALAARGFDLLAERLQQAMAAAGGDPRARLSASGEAYVLFAADNPGYFAVMFRPDLLDCDDPAFAAASAGAYGRLRGAISALHPDGDRGSADLELSALRAWAQAHGLASLWLSGMLSGGGGEGDIRALARSVFGT